MIDGLSLNCKTVGLMLPKLEAKKLQARAFSMEAKKSRLTTSVFTQLSSECKLITANKEKVSLHKLSTAVQLKIKFEKKTRSSCRNSVAWMMHFGVRRMVRSERNKNQSFGMSATSTKRCKSASALTFPSSAPFGPKNRSACEGAVGKGAQQVNRTSAAA